MSAKELKENDDENRGKKKKREKKKKTGAHAWVKKQNASSANTHTFDCHHCVVRCMQAQRDKRGRRRNTFKKKDAKSTHTDERTYVSFRSPQLSPNRVLFFSPSSKACCIEQTHIILTGLKEKKKRDKQREKRGRRR